MKGLCWVSFAGKAMVMNADEAAVTAAVGNIIFHLLSPTLGCTGKMGWSCLPLVMMDARAVALSAVANKAEQEKLS